MVYIQAVSEKTKIDTQNAKNKRRRDNMKINLTFDNMINNLYGKYADIREPKAMEEQREIEQKHDTAVRKKTEIETAEILNPEIEVY